MIYFQSMDMKGYEEVIHLSVPGAFWNQEKIRLSALDFISGEITDGIIIAIIILLTPLQ